MKRESKNKPLAVGAVEKIPGLVGLWRVLKTCRTMDESGEYYNTALIECEGMPIPKLLVGRSTRKIIKEVRI